MKRSVPKQTPAEPLLQAVKGKPIPLQKNVPSKTRRK